MDRGIPFFSDRYSNHVKTLITIIHDRTSSRYGSEDDSSSNIEHFPRKLVGNDFSKKQLIQHFYTYQKLNNNTLYDEYRELITTQNKIEQFNLKIEEATTGEEQDNALEKKDQLNLELEQIGLKFRNSFSEINSKTLMGSNPSVGACRDCLKYTGMKYSRYSKWISDKEKSDPNAWNYSKWN